jgi:hypothetical protein
MTQIAVAIAITRNASHASERPNSQVSRMVASVALGLVRSD